MKEINKNHMGFIQANATTPPKFKKYRMYAFNDNTGMILHTQYRKTENAILLDFQSLIGCTVYLTYNNKIYDIIKINSVM